MGCRTGFYLLLRDNVSRSEAIRLMQEVLAFVVDFEGEIPGTNRWECGNYLEHDLAAAKEVARDMSVVLADWTEEKMKYAE
jgi:S-ribosylhomocysteine lyase